MHPTSVFAGIQHGEVARSEGHHLKGAAVCLDHASTNAFI
ncbi:Hypothetical protein PMT_2390 [Prochlorococcus marinus str. MIT 9313]|uniref:Uncharacterized protein n=1 Tax=Prochlorococcus marinus (strain MIT 9313) TaxID=74547 RepID=B9ER96_PROMM|nr:Hypothetical protein PMT_2390 [Prochlorococcus marinus str. MIT 9313]